MSRIEEAFQNHKAFIAFITVGDPDLETTEKVVHAAVENGADLIELGIPFSDPTAEGPDIMEADEEDVHEKLILKENIQKLYEKLESSLSRRERMVLKMRYGLYGEEEYTQREISRLLGISRSYVSRIEKGAIEKLRKYF